MILGFVFQVEALRVGSLSVVQPVIATELVIVFGVIALHDPGRVHARDWISAVGVVIGLGAFLALARPHGGHAEASMRMWVLAGLATLTLAAALAALAYLPGRSGRRPGGGRKAALLGIAAAVGFGFVAAVVKELSSHLSQGPTGVLLNWSPYVLLVSGAAAMFLASNAFQAGSLAASQPGLTIVDPLVAAALGVVLFRESLDHNPLILCGEILAVATVVASVVVLSRSPLVQDAHVTDDRHGEIEAAHIDAAVELDSVEARVERRGSHALGTSIPPTSDGAATPAPALSTTNIDAVTSKRISPVRKRVGSPAR